MDDLTCYVKVKPMICACDTQRPASPKLGFSVAKERTDVLALALGTGGWRTRVESSSNQYSGIGREEGDL